MTGEKPYERRAAMINPIGSQDYYYNNAIYNNVGVYNKDPVATAINKAAGISLQNGNDYMTVAKIKHTECDTYKNREYIKYNVNPYDNAKKAIEGSLLKGRNIDRFA